MKVTRLFEFLVGCQHSSLSRVFTIGRRTYCVCYECGAEFDYVPGRKRGSLPVLDCQRAFAEVRVLVLPRSSAACLFRACHRLAPAVARHASFQLEGETVCSTQDFACSMTARPHANSPQFWPQTTMVMRQNQLNSLLEQMALGPRHQTLAVPSGGSGTGFKRYAYPLPAYCLLIGCWVVLATIRILNEMRLDYSPIHAGFAYKTTEQVVALARAIAMQCMQP